MEAIRPPPMGELYDRIAKRYGNTVSVSIKPKKGWRAHPQYCTEKIIPELQPGDKQKGIKNVKNYRQKHCKR